MIEWVNVNDRLPEKDNKVAVITEHHEIILVIFKNNRFGKYDIDDVLYWIEDNKILPLKEIDPSLINCPFCKGNNTKYIRTTFDYESGKHATGCVDCGFYRYHKTKEEAIEWWNNRSQCVHLWGTKNKTCGYTESDVEAVCIKCGESPRCNDGN